MTIAHSQGDAGHVPQTPLIQPFDRESHAAPGLPPLIAWGQTDKTAGVAVFGP